MKSNIIYPTFNEAQEEMVMVNHHIKRLVRNISFSKHKVEKFIKTLKINF